MNKKKRAEITTQQIVLLVILIASFAVILFFLLRLNLGKTSDETICHNAVVLRSTIPKVIPKESVPLNCKTSYVCITKDGTCEAMSGNREIIKVKNAEEIYYNLAEKMANCWWIFGEGKLNYIGDTFNKELYCSICSQIAFDDSLNKIFPNGEIDKKDFYDYLSGTNISGKGESYLDYLLELKSSQLIQDNLKTDNYEFGDINFGNQYYVVMGIFSEISVAKWAVLGIGVGVLSFIALPLTPIFGPSLSAIVALTSGPVAGGVAGTLVGIVLKGESGHEYLSPLIIEANSAEFNKLQCEDIKTLA